MTRHVRITRTRAGDIRIEVDCRGTWCSTVLDPGEAEQAVRELQEASP